MKKTYSCKYKADVVLELLKEQKTLAQLAGEKGVHTNVIARWRKTAVDKFPLLFDDDKRPENKIIAEQKQTIQELYAQIGELSTKLNWLKKKSGINIQS